MMLNPCTGLILRPQRVRVTHVTRALPYRAVCIGSLTGNEMNVMVLLVQYGWEIRQSFYLDTLKSHDCPSLRYSYAALATGNDWLMGPKMLSAVATRSACTIIH